MEEDKKEGRKKERQKKKEGRKVSSFVLLTPFPLGDPTKDIN